MLLHTIIPLEAVLQEPPAPDALLAVRSVAVDCGFLELSGGAESFRVQRLISTDLRAYLNPAYFPGTQYGGNGQSGSPLQNR